MRLTPLAILRRLGSGLVVLWLVSMIVFAASQLLPGSPGRAILGQQASAEAVQALDAQLGYDRPVLERYLDWFGGMLRGDLGVSYAYGVPVREVLAGPLLRSLELGVLAFVIGIPLALVLGLLAARRQGSALDHGIVGLGLLTTVVPAFVIGIVLIVTLSLGLGWFPVNASGVAASSGVERLRGLLLPALTLVAVIFGYVVRVTRAGFIQELGEGYARTARLKGAGELRVLLSHAARNALAPTAVVVATQASYLVGGGVVIEKLFNYPGLGLAMLAASEKVDIPVLAAVVMIMGTATIVSYLVADIALTLLSPRLRSGQ